MNTHYLRVLVLGATSLFLFGSSVAAQCSGACGIGVPNPFMPTTWTTAHSPVCVIADMIFNGITIEPGVEICVKPGVRIDVGTGVTAQGTIAQPIVFHAAQSGMPWLGIRFNNSQPGSILEHCRIEGATESGVQIIDSVPTIRHCEIVNNHSLTSGGGVRVVMNSGSLTALRLEDCRIANNTCRFDGGGIHASLVSGTLELVRCSVVENAANPGISNGNYEGGGVYLADGDTFDGDEATFLLENCLVRENTVFARATSTQYSQGGGAFIGGGCQITMRNCALDKNHAQTYSGDSNNDRYAFGGGLTTYACTASVDNCIFGCNTVSGSAGSRGGGAYVGHVAANFTNCVFTRNGFAGLYSEGGTVSLTNCIAYFNYSNGASPPVYGGQIAGGLANITSDYCDIQGLLSLVAAGMVSSVGDIDVGPGFVGQDCDCRTDYALAPGALTTN